MSLYLEDQMAELVRALAELKAEESDVPLAAIHMEQIEPHGIGTYKVNELHRKVGFGRYAS